MKNEFIYPMRVHIEDTDFTGLVFHSNYLNFMERARSEWMEQVGLGMDWQREHQIYFLIHSANIQFLAPVQVHTKVEVVSTITSLRPASLVFHQYLRLSDAADKLLCKADIKLACVNSDMRPRLLPESAILDTIRRELT